MNRELIKQIALEAGFKLKPQPSGEDDLNPYVYRFAELVALASMRHLEPPAIQIPGFGPIIGEVHKVVEGDFDNVVDLTARRDKLNGPDADLVYMDDDGVLWYKYGVEYKDQRGKTMTFHLWAQSFDDAKARLQLLGENGWVYGQIISDNIPLE